MSKILIVDGSAIQRTILRKFLKKGNHENIVEAKNAEEAIPLYLAMKPDIVILDVVLPDANGIAILRNIIENDRHANVIMCSFIALQNVIIESIQHGAKSFLVKPIMAETLLGAVDKVMSMNKITK